MQRKGQCLVIQTDLVEKNIGVAQYVDQKSNQLLYFPKQEVDWNYRAVTRAELLTLFPGGGDGDTWIFSGITKPYTRLHPPPPSSFLSPPSSLQHPQQYLNQNIAGNWAISPNLGRKIKSCPFWLKIGTHGILEVLIPNPDLDFWNLDPKIHFWVNVDPKSQSCSLANMASMTFWKCRFWIRT